MFSAVAASFSAAPAGHPGSNMSVFSPILVIFWLFVNNYPDKCEKE